ncbi:hypothetical protein ACFX1R_034775 [Malus domestica]
MLELRLCGVNNLEATEGILVRRGAQEDRVVATLLEAVVEVHLEEGGPESMLLGEDLLNHCADDEGGLGASGVVEG